MPQAMQRQFHALLHSIVMCLNVSERHRFSLWCQTVVTAVLKSKSNTKTKQIYVVWLLMKKCLQKMKRTSEWRLITDLFFFFFQINHHIVCSSTLCRKDSCSQCNWIHIDLITILLKMSIIWGKKKINLCSPSQPSKSDICDGCWWVRPHEILVNVAARSHFREMYSRPCETIKAETFVMCFTASSSKRECNRQAGNGTNKNWNNIK